MSEVISNSVLGEAVAEFGATLLAVAAMKLDFLPDTPTSTIASLAAGSLVVGHALWRAGAETQQRTS